MQGVDKPLPYLFYRGIELHPRIFDVDVKQVNIFNCQNFFCTIKNIKGDLISEGQAFSLWSPRSHSPKNMQNNYAKLFNLKVSKSCKKIMVSSILPKTNKTHNPENVFYSG